MTDAPTDRQILEFENRFYLHYGAKVSAIRDELGMTDVRFFQRLRQIALAPAPDLAAEFVHVIDRTRRRMEIRQHQRAS